MNKTFPPPPKTPRVSVPVSGEVLLVFQRLAAAGNMSTSRAMAEWLADTVEAADLMASTMERARAAPKIVTAELHAMMLGMADQAKEMADKYRKFKGSIDETGAESGAQVKRSGQRPAAAPANPPACNTGGKVPPKTQTNAPKEGKTRVNPQKNGGKGL